MSFMADYGDDHQEDDYSWSREAKQRWGVVAIFLVAIVLVNLFI